MLLPCLFKTRISTVSSATNMRPSAAEYPTPAWVSFQSATRVSFAPAATPSSRRRDLGAGTARRGQDFGRAPSERTLSAADTLRLRRHRQAAAATYELDADIERRLERHQ